MVPRTLTLTLAAAALLLAPHQAVAHDRPGHGHHHHHHHHHPPPPVVVARSLVRVTLEDAYGSSLRSFRHQGQTYVLGSMGSRYNIRLTNDSPERVEVVVGVDGRDVIHGRPSSVYDRGYLVPAYGSVLVRGYRTSFSSVAAFRFTSPPASYAGRHGHAYTAGVIQVAAYRERPRPVLLPAPLPYRDRRPAPPASPRAGAEQKRPSAGAPAHDSHRRGTPEPPSTSNLGTQFGEQTESHVMQTRFFRANRYRPDQRLTLRYDDAQGLEALGIVVYAPPPQPWYPPAQPLAPQPPAPRPQSRFAQPPP